MSDSPDERIVDIRTRRPWRPAADRTAAVFGVQAAVATVAVLLALYCFQHMIGAG
jgi:hypothetical protein